jgi:DNA-binding CsgD family transcriptional regulator
MTWNRSLEVTSALCPYLVDRVVELADLESQLAKATAGSAVTALVSGEAGVGKSRLLRELGRRAQVGGAHVLIGTCIEMSAGDLPYAPLVEAFHGLVRRLGLPAVRDLIGPGLTALAPLIPLFGGALAAAPPDAATRAQAFGSVLQVLGRLGTEAPVLLVIEDLHWADRSTLDLLAYLVQYAVDERLFLLASCRSGEIGPKHPLRILLSEFDRSRLVRRLDLAPFDRGQLRELLSGVMGAVPAATVIDNAWELSDGNAFFAEELAVSGVLNAGARLEIRLPSSLRELLLARIDLLGDDAQEVLRVAATAGRRVSYRLLARVCELPERRLLAALRECVSAHVLVVHPDDDTYLFRHALSREAVHSALLPGERGLLHTALAEALTADPELSYAQDFTLEAELAHHWFQAGDREKALRAAVRAGGAAARVQAFAESERQYGRALEIWPTLARPETTSDASHADVLRRGADAARWAGHVDLAVAWTRQARAEVDPAADPDLAAALSERLGRYLWEAGDGAGSERAYADAGALLADRPASALRARVLAQQANSLVTAGQHLAGLARATEALELARTVGADAEAGRALNVCGVAMTLTGRPEEGVGTLREALAAAEAAGHLEDLYRAYGNLSFALEQAGRLEEVLDVCRAGLALSRRLGLDRSGGAGLLTNNSAEALFLLGRWDEAGAVAAGAVAQGGASGAAVYPHLVLAQISLARGHLPAADEQLTLARALCQQRWEPHLLAPLHACAAELALARGDYSACRDAVDTGLAPASDFAVAPALRLCALGLRGAADRLALLATAPRPDPDALATVRAAAGLLAQRVSALAEGPLLPEAAALLALCGAEVDRAAARAEPAQWAQVAAVWTASGRRHPAAYAYWRLAEAAADVGDRDTAQTAARVAHRLAGELGTAPLSHQLDLLARRERLRLEPPESLDDPPPPGTAGARVTRLGLTAREFEVLGHLCEGRRNSEIATALFISEKTASVHVSNILAKLGVASRGQAAAIAHRLGLFEDASGNEEAPTG